MAVVIEAMRPGFFRWTAAVDFTVTSHVEMVTDVTEAAVANVIGGNLRSSGPRPEAWPSSE